MTALTLPGNPYVPIEEFPESSRHLSSFDKKYSNMMPKRSGILIDRSKTIDFYNGSLDFPNTTPIPKITTSLSIEECIEESVFKLCEIAKNKRIYILWSGGIDSSAALLGIWKYGKILFDNNKVSLLHSRSSVRESPFLYDWIVRNKILTEEVGSVTKFIKDQPQGSSDTNDKSNIYVTGEIGDQIMGNFQKKKLGVQLPIYYMIIVKQRLKQYLTCYRGSPLPVNTNIQNIDFGWQLPEGYPHTIFLIQTNFKIGL